MIRHCRLLTRHFFRGFLENDVLSPDEGMQATLAPLLAAIAAPGLLLPLYWSFNYGWPFQRVAEFQALALRHEVILVMYPMVIVALAMVLNWESLFPDRRDTEVLGRLPVPVITVFWAKLSALFLFVGLFAIASNLFPTVLYPLVANIRSQPGSPGGPLTLAAQVVATFGAAIFAALAVLSVLGLMQVVLTARARLSVAPYVQLASVLALVLSLLMLPLLIDAVDPKQQGRLAEMLSLHRLYEVEGRGTIDWLNPPADSAFELDPVHGGMRQRPGAPARTAERSREAFAGDAPATALAEGAGMSRSAPLMFWCPPLWFVGWYEVIAGRGSSAARLLAARAQLGLVAAAAIALACYLVAYRRHAAGALLASGPGRSRRAGRWRHAAATLRRLLVRDPAARAFGGFTIKTLARSSRHRLVLGASLGAALAFVLAGSTTSDAAGKTASPSASLLSVQYVLAVFMLAGARLAFAVPSVLPANWTFRFHGPDNVAPCGRGVRRAVAAWILVPLFVVLLPLHVVQLGWYLAGLHTVFGFVASLVLLEALLAGFPKIPFAAPYVPGRAQIRLRLTIYFVGFQVFAYSIAALERLAILHPAGTAALLGVMFAAYATAVVRRRRRADPLALVFEEDPPDTVQTLGLAGPLSTGRLRIAPDADRSPQALTTP